jgi:hypothetical protein
MATTESRSGFRLPWAGEHRTDEQTDTDQPLDQAAEMADTADPGIEATATSDSSPSATELLGSDATSSEATAGTVTGERMPGESMSPAAPAGSAPSAAVSGVPTPARKPTKFLADLTKAMQAAAESERQETLELFQLEAKSFVETIHGRSSTEAEELRKQADEDIASIRDWSKQEIARVREETDQKISARKAELTEEIDDHAARIEREIDRVQKTVADYEQQMVAFFESLLGETDPTRFAALAASLPEPPAFVHQSPSEATAVATGAKADPAENDPTEQTAAEPTEAVAEPLTQDEPGATESQAAEEPELSDGDREAAFAAIEAAARAADGAESVADGAPEAESEPESQPVAIGDLANGSTAPDPRLSALGLADFDAAEAEALEDLPAADEEIPEIPEIADDALAARLAGLVPEGGTEAPRASGGAPAETAQTTVVVAGLVSVASIASFKRHLARVPGVRSVGVSSGPDGEFVFTVSHDPGLELRDVVPGVPGFGARVTESGDGFVRATAHDADSGA